MATFSGLKSSKMRFKLLYRWKGKLFFYFVYDYNDFTLKSRPNFLSYQTSIMVLKSDFFCYARSLLLHIQLPVFGSEMWYNCGIWHNWPEKCTLSINGLNLTCYCENDNFFQRMEGFYSYITLISISLQVPISPDPDGQITGNMSMDCLQSTGLQNATQIHEELTGKDASWILTTAVIIFTMQTGRTFLNVNKQDMPEHIPI